MTSVVASAAHAAHSLAASLLATAQIQVGGTIPTKEVKEDSPTTHTPINLKGKNIIVGVPGAFTGTCHAQVPGYLEAYEEFKAKGVQEIYVVSVNDVFVAKAWKENLAPNGSKVHFIADDNASFTSSLGLLFDASPVLGGPRSKRYVIVTEDNKVTALAIEPDPSQITITDAKVILAQV